LGHAPGDLFHRGLEILVRGVHEQPLPQDGVRRQRGEVGADRRLMLVAGANQHAMPFPAAGFCRLDEDEHLPLEKICREPSEHPLREKGRVPVERGENPLVVERLHA
jgi:hypothetical protein